MCDPVSAGVAIASTALSAGGSYLSKKEQENNQKRMVSAARNAAEAERIRQKGFQEQATPVFNESLEGQSVDKQKAKLADDQTKRVAATKANINTQTEYNPPLASAPNVVKSEIGRKMAEAVTKAQAQGANLGKLSAWTDLGLQNKTALNDANTKLGTISNFSKGSLRLLPLEQEVAARNASKPSSGFGDLLQGLGMAVGLAGGLGAFNGLGSGAGSAASGMPYGQGMMEPQAIYGLY